MVKNHLPCRRLRRHGFDLWGDPLEEEVATHSSILAWKIPRTKKPGGLHGAAEKSDTTERLNMHAVSH